MPHPFPIRVTRYEPKIEEHIEALIDQPLFVQCTRNLDVAIYPIPYDYSSMFDNRKTGPAVVGLIYHCYTIQSFSGSHKRLEYDEIPDWFLLDLDDDKLKGRRAELLELIRGIECYKHKIPEQQFVDTWQRFATAMVPNNQFKVIFKNTSSND